MAKPSRASLERARDSAMLQALYFWTLSDRAANIGVRDRWNTEGNVRSANALRLDKTLRGEDAND